jgi:hypothetical protein
MNTLEYVKQKQKYWAKMKNINLQGSKGELGDPIYTLTLKQNMFQMLSESTKRELQQGDGNELGDETGPGKIQALHSSSALGINAFEYWKMNKRFTTMAKALGVSTLNIDHIEFEEKYEIFRTAKKHPNIDVNIHYKNQYLIGIECKYTEPFQYRNMNSGLKTKYINDFQFWHEFPNLKIIASEISPNDDKYKYLHCAQLIKHVLGMYIKKRNKSKFMLMYIYQP